MMVRGGNAAEPIVCDKGGVTKGRRVDVTVIKGCSMVPWMQVYGGELGCFSGCSVLPCIGPEDASDFGHHGVFICRYLCFLGQWMEHRQLHEEVVKQNRRANRPLPLLHLL